MTPALAILDLQMLVVKVLAVAGGGALGFLGGGLLLRALCRFLFVRRPPRRAVLTTRILGAVVLGWLVYLWVFGSGGWGWLGGGGGWWPFGGRGGAGNGASSAPMPTAQKQAPTKEAEPVRVLVLGGRKVVDQRFYLVEGESQAWTWPELVNYLTRQLQKEPDLRVAEIILYKDSVDRDNPAVSDLETWAKEHGLTPKISTPPGNGPDIPKARAGP